MRGKLRIRRSDGEKFDPALPAVAAAAAILVPIAEKYGPKVAKAIKPHVIRLVKKHGPMAARRLARKLAPTMAARFRFDPKRIPGFITESHIRSAGRFVRSGVKIEHLPIVVPYFAEWLWSQQKDRDRAYTQERIRKFLLSGRGL